MALSMEKLYCELFQFTIKFDEKNFKDTLFKKETDSEEIAENTFVAHSLGKTEHVHVEITFGSESGVLDVSFHNGGLEKDVESNKTPLEDCVKDISKFFTKKRFDADLTAIYRFDKHYTPLIQLHYPLLIGDKDFQQATISGYEIDFPENSILKRLLISARNESIVIIMSADFSVNLHSFNLHSEIERFAKYTHSLVAPKEKKNEKTRKKEVK